MHLLTECVPLIECVNLFLRVCFSLTVEKHRLCLCIVLASVEIECSLCVCVCLFVFHISLPSVIDCTSVWRVGAAPTVTIDTIFCSNECDFPSRTTVCPWSGMARMCRLEISCRTGLLKRHSLYPFCNLESRMRSWLFFMPCFVYHAHVCVN